MSRILVVLFAALLWSGSATAPGSVTSPNLSAAITVGRAGAEPPTRLELPPLTTD